jgi:hypothetical protein
LANSRSGTISGSTSTLLSRQFLHLAAGTAALAAVSRLAGAQPYPARPARIIVGPRNSCSD